MRILGTSKNILEVGICCNWVHLVMDLNMFFFWQVQTSQNTRNLLMPSFFFLSILTALHSASNSRLFCCSIDTSPRKQAKSKSLTRNHCWYQLLPFGILINITLHNKMWKWYCQGKKMNIIKHHIESNHT
jgi:hypothetical protein